MIALKPRFSKSGLGASSLTSRVNYCKEVSLRVVLQRGLSVPDPHIYFLQYSAEFAPTGDICSLAALYTTCKHLHMVKERVTTRDLSFLLYSLRAFLLYSVLGRSGLRFHCYGFSGLFFQDVQCWPSQEETQESLGLMSIQ